jgi:hypothetical protein
LNILQIERNMLYIVQVSALHACELQKLKGEHVIGKNELIPLTPVVIVFSSKNGCLVAGPSKSGTVNSEFLFLLQLALAGGCVIV